MKQVIDIKANYYNECLRYMRNASETLKKAKKNNFRYTDAKYVKTACGIAYNAVLLALDCVFIYKNIKLPRNRKNVEFYQSNLAVIDKKLLTHFIEAYKILHLSGYYDGILDAKVISAGFDLANLIIGHIKPLKNQSVKNLAPK